MTTTKHTTIHITKCNCGHESCDYHGTSDGTFGQGSGYDKATAKFHVRACNAHEIYEQALVAISLDAFLEPQRAWEIANAALRKARGEA